MIAARHYESGFKRNVLRGRNWRALRGLGLIEGDGTAPPEEVKPGPGTTGPGTPGPGPVRPSVSKSIINVSSGAVYPYLVPVAVTGISTSWIPILGGIVLLLLATRR